MGPAVDNQNRVSLLNHRGVQMKNKFSIAMSLAVILAMLITSLALADNLKDDVVVGGNDTFTAGGSTTINYWIQDTGGTCDAADGSKATVTINVPAGVTANPASLLFSACNTVNQGTPNNTQSVTFTSSTAGTYSITASVSDTSGSYNPAPANFTLHVIEPVVTDSTAPVWTVPAGVVAEATGPFGASVTYTASASDPDDAVSSQSCSPASGSTFPLGTTVVNCTANDTHGNTGTAQFGVTVQDTTAPAIASHADVTAEATSAAGAAVSYTSPSTSDAVDGAGTATCSPASDSQFALGETTVTCNATDGAGNAATPTTFKVKVVDTTPPTIAAHADVTAEATSAAGAAVTYTSPATSDAVDGAGTATCTPASGSQFALSETTVTCNASDAAGNAATSTTFMVKVVDTTPPSLALPNNISATAPANSSAVVTYTASASDLVDGPVSVTCTPASGSSFSVGTTTVSCSAIDAHGNTGTGSFTVTVSYSWNGFFQPIDNNGVFNVVKSGSTIPAKFSLGGDQGLAILAAGSPTSVLVACPASALLDTVEELSTATVSGLKYDALANQYIYNWKTASSYAGTCRQLKVILADGSVHTALFKFNK
jgi:hypothetical protein